MRRQDFSYELPDALIARAPAAQRRGSRLLQMDGVSGQLSHLQFPDLLDLVEPDFVHVLSDGRILKSGDKSLALELERRGYDWLREGTAAASPTSQASALSCPAQALISSGT